jgi:hypothetical protein
MFTDDIFIVLLLIYLWADGIKKKIFLPVECRWTTVQAPAVRIEALGYFVPGNYEIFELHIIFLFGRQQYLIVVWL